MKAILETLTISERRACAIAKCNRRTFRYKSHRITDDAPLRKRLEELAAERRRFGYRRLAVLLQREGIVVNLKRIRRVYSEANLQVRRRIRRRLALGRGNLAAAASSMNERWSLDFVHDTLSSKRRIRALTIVDDFTHGSLAIEVDTALPANAFRGSSTRSPRPVVIQPRSSSTTAPNLPALRCYDGLANVASDFITSLQENQPRSRLLKASTASFATSVSTKMTSRI